MEKISEEMKVHEEWYKEARDKSMTMEKLPEFLKKLTENYSHDYGTICHAMTAGALATMWAIDRTPTGGITGFQASCIMWSFIKHWNMTGDNPMRLIDYNDLLFPQMGHKFKKISRATWDWVQAEARKKLKDRNSACESVVNHWESIADGQVPFGLVVEKEGE